MREGAEAGAAIRANGLRRPSLCRILALPLTASACRCRTAGTWAACSPLHLRPTPACRPQDSRPIPACRAAWAAALGNIQARL